MHRAQLFRPLNWLAGERSAGRFPTCGRRNGRVRHCWQGTYGAFAGRPLKVDSQARACACVHGTFHATEKPENVDGERIATQDKTKPMLLTSSLFFASALYIGGGTVGLLLVIVVVVLMLRG